MSLVSPRGRQLAGWLSFFSLFIILITGLRFYIITRLKPRPLHVEDLFIVISVVAELALTGATFWVANAVYVIVFITFQTAQCSPIWAAWDEALSQTNCRSIVIQEVASVASNLFLDFAVVVLPIPFVTKLQMPLGKKIGICAMFSLGSGVIGILSWRLHTTLTPEKPPDMVYDLYLTALQSHTELFLGITAANLPMLGPLLTRIPKMRICSRLTRSPLSSGSDASKRARSIVTFGSAGQERQGQGQGQGGDELQLLTIEDERRGDHSNKTQNLRSRDSGVSVERSNTNRTTEATPPGPSAQTTHPEAEEV
ncbi:hypothetical protein F5Y14DRAFT_457029 [Nemania sp. NC0429]|nr:hypothetical protein F5Y14DRAFT_457029 [Nemania sp. NC0429]